nr:hydroxyproline-rich glycoprotein family protein [Ipomoea batatas]
MLSFAVASSTVEVSLSLLRPCRLPKLPLRVAAALAFSAVVIYPTRAGDFRGCIFPGWPRCCNVGARGLGFSKVVFFSMFIKLGCGFIKSGTGVSVEAVSHVFQTNMLDMLKQTGLSPSDTMANPSLDYRHLYWVGQLAWRFKAAPF